MSNTASVRESQTRASGKLLGSLVHIVSVITNTQGAPSIMLPTLSADMPLVDTAAPLDGTIGVIGRQLNHFPLSVGFQQMRVASRNRVQVCKSNMTDFDQPAI